MSKKQNKQKDFTSSSLLINPKNYPCPICGSPMEYVSERELYGKGNREPKFLLCREDDVHGETFKSHSKNVYLKSVPAGPVTRRLRTEAHHYFNRLYTDGLLPGKDSAYFWLTQALGFYTIGRSYCKHIGEMDDFMLKQTIEKVIRYLHEHRDKLKQPVSPYHYSCSYTSSRSDLMDLLVEINLGFGVDAVQKASSSDTSNGVKDND